MRINPIEWFRQNWPRNHVRVIDDYILIGRDHRAFLADVALRGFVYVPMPHPRDVFEAGKNEGRRELAIEIINMASAPHDALRALIEAAQRNGGKA